MHYGGVLRCSKAVFSKDFKYCEKNNFKVPFFRTRHSGTRDFFQGYIYEDVNLQ